MTKSTIRPRSRRGGRSCQVPNCTADLGGCKGYYQRYRICQFHLQNLSLEVHGVESRFCQQCGKFQPVGDFDGDRRSCRSQLLKHNTRRNQRNAARKMKLKRRCGGELQLDQDELHEQHEEQELAADSPGGQDDVGSCLLGMASLEACLPDLLGQDGDSQSTPASSSYVPGYGPSYAEHECGGEALSMWDSDLTVQGLLGMPQVHRSSLSAPSTTMLPDLGHPLDLVPDHALSMFALDPVEPLDWQPSGGRPAARPRSARATFPGGGSLLLPAPESGPLAAGPTPAASQPMSPLPPPCAPSPASAHASGGWFAHRPVDAAAASPPPLPPQRLGPSPFHTAGSPWPSAAMAATAERPAKQRRLSMRSFSTQSLISNYSNSQRQANALVPGGYSQQHPHRRVLGAAAGEPGAGYGRCTGPASGSGLLSTMMSMSSGASGQMGCTPSHGRLSNCSSTPVAPSCSVSSATWDRALVAAKWGPCRDTPGGSHELSGLLDDPTGLMMLLPELAEDAHEAGASLLDSGAGWDPSAMQLLEGILPDRASSSYAQQHHTNLMAAPPSAPPRAPRLPPGPHNPRGAPVPHEHLLPRVVPDFEFECDIVRLRLEQEEERARRCMPGFSLDFDAAMEQLCAKLHNCRPEQLPAHLRERLQSWLQTADGPLLQTLGLL